MKCFSCKKKLKVLYLTKKDKKRLPQEHLYDRASVFEIVMGYGSKFDTDTFIFGLCDDCINVKLKGKLNE